MDLAGRFLHVNLNTTDVARSGAFYEEVGALRTVMRTDPEPADGAVFGVEGTVVARAHFLYDARGPRAATALELVQWDDPPTWGEVYPDPGNPGLHALCISAPRPPTVLRDPDGVAVEIVRGEGDPYLAGMRLHCTDLVATTEWYQHIGFAAVDGPSEVDVPGLGTVPAAWLALPEDDPPFRLCAAQIPAGKVTGTSYPQGNHVGLYRMALRVEDVATACATVGLPVTGPLSFHLAGTKLDDLHIAFLRDPDGVVVEFVERPASQFR